MEIKMEINDGKGRKFSSLVEASESAFDEIIADTLMEAERAIRRYICPVHNRQPFVTRRQMGSKTELQITACCDDAKTRAEETASRALRC
jgi:hypothetical protein